MKIYNWCLQIIFMNQNSVRGKQANFTPQNVLHILGKSEKKSSLIKSVRLIKFYNTLIFISSTFFFMQFSLFNSHLSTNKLFLLTMFLDFLNFALHIMK